jgi:membrane protease YdiL (CAAX protease family)
VTGAPPPSTHSPPAGAAPPASRRSELAGDGGPGWPWWMAPAALAIALVAPLAAVIVLLIAGVDVGSSSGNGAGSIVLTAVQDAAFIGAALFLARTVGPLRARDFGLRATPFWRAVGVAALALVAYLVFTTVWNAAVVGHQRQDDVFKELGVRRSSDLAIAVLAVLICVVAPIAEEFLFRGFCFGALRPTLGVGGAALAVGVVFGAVHATSTPGVLLVELSFLGFLLCLVRWRTGSLYPCIGLHALNNSISYGALLHWGWQIAPLVAGSLAAITLLVRPFSDSVAAVR